MVRIKKKKQNKTKTKNVGWFKGFWGLFNRTLMNKCNFFFFFWKYKSDHDWPYLTIGIKFLSKDFGQVIKIFTQNIWQEIGAGFFNNLKIKMASLINKDGSKRSMERQHKWMHLPQKIVANEGPIRAHQHDPKQSPPSVSNK